MSNDVGTSGQPGDDQGPMLNAERLDNQPLDSESASQLRELETYLRSIESVEADKLFDEIVPDEEPEEAGLARNYNVFPLSRTANGRTYNINVRIDPDFGDLTNRVRQIAEHMLENVVVNQVPNFVARATDLNQLTWRRSRTLRFPHSLPWRSPPPNTFAGKVREEAEVVATAVHFPLSRPAPGIDFTIDQFSKGPNGRTWTTGCCRRADDL